MRTSSQARNSGVASYLLNHIIKIAQQRGYSRLSLETGSMPFFKPARHFYKKFGFIECPPFGDYRIDPYSVFMTKEII